MIENNNEPRLTHYLQKYSHLRTDRTGGWTAATQGQSLHKPISLLPVVEVDIYRQVYALYGLTEAETRIVEGGQRGVWTTNFTKGREKREMDSARPSPFRTLRANSRLSRFVYFALFRVIRVPKFFRPFRVPMFFAWS